MLENTVKQFKEHDNGQIEQITQQNLQLVNEINILTNRSVSDKADHDKTVKGVEDKCNRWCKMLLRNKTKVQRRTRKFEFIEEEKVSNVNPNAKENESPNQNQEPE